MRSYHKPSDEWDKREKILTYTFAELSKVFTKMEKVFDANLYLDFAKIHETFQEISELVNPRKRAKSSPYYKNARALR